MGVAAEVVATVRAGIAEALGVVPSRATCVASEAPCTVPTTLLQAPEESTDACKLQGVAVGDWLPATGGCCGGSVVLDTRGGRGGGGRGEENKGQEEGGGWGGGGGGGGGKGANEGAGAGTGTGQGEDEEEAGKGTEVTAGGGGGGGIGATAVEGTFSEPDTCCATRGICCTPPNSRAKCTADSGPTHSMGGPMEISEATEDSQSVALKGLIGNLSSTGYL